MADSFITEQTLQRLYRYSVEYDVSPDELINRLLDDYEHTPCSAHAVTRLSDELNASQNLLSTILDFLPIGICLTNADGRYTLVNPAYCALYGYEEHELIGQASTIIHPQKTPHIEMNPCSAEGTAHHFYESEHRRKDGTPFYVEAENAFLPGSDGQYTVITTVRDVSERKQMEDELRQSVELFRAFVAQSNDGIILTDTEGCIIEWNSAMTGITGLDDHKVLGKPIWEVQTATADQETHPENIEGLSFMVRQALKGYAAPWLESPQEMTIRHQDQSRRVILSVTFPIEANGRRQLGSIIHDITHRKQAQIREMEITLERERLNLLKQFIQKTAHEFRTPLTAINTAAYLMARTQDETQRQQRIKQINDQVSLISNLMDMILKTTRLEDSTLDFQPVDIQTLLNELCQTLQSKYVDKTLNCRISGDLPRFTGDATALQDAITALIENAERYGREDGTITVTAFPSADYIVITVQDEGQGIEADALPHIFQTFYRYDAAHSTPGMGLGLSFARRIIQMHGGNIDVESKTNHGTTFFVYLPV